MLADRQANCGRIVGELSSSLGDYRTMHLAHQLNAERERSLEIEEGRPRAEREIQLEPRSEPKEQNTT